MNLAFLGYYSKVVFPKKDLYHWPDGIFTKKIINIKKIPGRDLIKKIAISKDIKTIKIIGNLSTKSKKFLKRKFKLRILQEKIPYAPINQLLKKKIFLKKSEIVFIITNT